MTLLVFALFALLRPDTFPTGENIKTMLDNSAVSLILAFAVLVPLVVGYFDVSTANVLGLGGVAVVVFIGKLGLPVSLALLAVVAAGALIGALNAVVVVGFGVDSFIATIASSSVVSGITLAITSGAVVYSGITPGFLHFGQTTLPAVGVDLPVLYAVALAVALWYLLHHTRLGRFLYGIGSNREVARLSGIPVMRIAFCTLVVSGLLSAFAGAVESAQNGSGDPTIGPDFLLPAFASVFLGATAFTPGFPNVGGTVVAVMLLTIITDGLGQLGAPVYVEPIFQGAILIVAVILSRQLSPTLRRKIRLPRRPSLSADRSQGAEPR